ncbi:MAG: cadmium-translocating P-type ATPase [Ruminococcus sp.]|nr:cadmium-translocating P-type ATPase [Ruminococcus sp.]
MEKVYHISDLDCAHCGAKIEEALGKLEGIESAVLNFPLRKLHIRGDITDETLALMNETANSIEPGVRIHEGEHDHHRHHEHEHHHECCHDHDHDHAHEHSHEHSHGHHHEHAESLAGELAPLLAGLLLFAGALIADKLADIFPLALGLYIAAYLVLGFNVLTATVKNLRAGKIFDENFLMTVATVGAFVLGEYPEAVGVVLFFRIGELFEDYAVSRSRRAITDVTSLRVDEAEVLRGDEFVRVHAEEIQVGDVLRIKAGGRIAADGVIEGAEHGVKIDTSAVNGEPVPLVAYSGDSVMSGCISLSDSFRLRVTAAAEDSMISKIARAVETASAEKPHIDRFITRFAKIYTPAVIAAAAFTAIVPSLITGDWSKWIYSALTFLVISCPCALVLSVPLAYFSGIGAASKLGILFKGGASLEALGKVRAVAFDKTGTLTDGTFNITDIQTFGTVSETELLSICGSCEQTSSHPVAERITGHCRENSIPLTEPTRTEELAGRGISAELDGKRVLCGNERLMSENSIDLPAGEVPAGSVVYVAVDGRAVGRIVISDTMKKTSAAAVGALKALGCRTAMLTGDKAANAEAVGRAAGVDEIRSELLPDGKLAEINKLRGQYGSVMFVGDGINDAPVLAGADVGGAMQTGADLALEAADVVFMSAEPESAVRAKRIADKTLRIAYENILFALAVKALVLILGLLGHPSMWFAVFADSGVAMLLILNSVRVLGTKAYTK